MIGSIVLKPAKQSVKSKSTCLFIHGWGVSSVAWQLVSAPLEQWFTIKCIDLPGFGIHVENCPTNYQLDQLVDQVALEVPTASLVVGWSMGGLVAIRLASRYPDKVKALCLVASNPCFIGKNTLHDNWPGIDLQLIQPLTAAVLQNTKAAIARFLTIQAMGSEFARADIKWLKQVMADQPLANIKALLGGLAILQHSDLRRELLGLNLPITAIFGELDQLVPVKILSILAQQMPNFRYAILDKAAHAPFISHPQQFVQLFIELIYG